MARKDDDLTEDDIRRILARREEANKMRQDARSRMTSREMMYADLKEGIVGKNILAEKAEQMGKQSKELDKTIQNIIKQAETGKLSYLQTALKRLTQLSKIVKKDKFNPQEYERLISNITETQSVIQKDLNKKTGTFSKIKNTVKKTKIDVGSLLVGMSGGDPLVGLAVSSVGNLLKGRRERKAEEQTKTNQQLNLDAEGIARDFSSVQPERTGKIIAPLTQQMESQKKSVETITTEKKLLEDISLYTEEISGDIKKLVRIAENSEETLRRTRLTNVENEIEKNRKPGLLGETKIKTPAGSPIQNIVSKIMSSLLPAGIGLAGLGGILGATATNPIAWLAGGIIYTALDGIMGLFKAKEWGVSSISGLVGGIIGGSLNDKLLNTFANMGKWAAIGAGVGSVLPGVGTIIGGLLGAAFGGIMGYVGGEEVAQFVDDATNFISDRIGQTIDIITGVFSDIVDSVLELFNSIKQKVFGLIDDAKAALGLGGSELNIKDNKASAEQKAFLKQAKDLGPDPRIAGQGLLESNESYQQRIKEYDTGIKGAKLATQNRRKRGMELKNANPESSGLVATAVPMTSPGKTARVNLTRMEEGSAPNITNSNAVDILNSAMDDAGITDPTERAAFMAQMAHETNGFKFLRELGGEKYFDKYEPTTQKGQELGNLLPGDGSKYKGRGFIQLTGRDNYRRFGNMIGIDLENNPLLAEQPAIAAKVAVAYWKTRVRPNVKDFSDVAAVTKPINSGLAGLEKRKEYFGKFQSNSKLTSSSSKPSVAKMDKSQALASSQKAADRAQTQSKNQVVMIPAPMTPQLPAMANRQGTTKTGQPMTSTGQPSIRQALMG